MIDCEHCLYGRPLGNRDYKCVNRERQKFWELDSKTYTLINKGSYSCKFAEDQIISKEK